LKLVNINHTVYDERLNADGKLKEQTGAFTLYT
jgi:hypothetical protein